MMMMMGCSFWTYQCQGGGGGGGREGGGGAYIGWDFDRLLGRGVGHLKYLAVLGVGIFEFLFVPETTNHFLGWGISVILTSHHFDLTFLPRGREFYSNFLENVEILPYAPPLAPSSLTLIGALWVSFPVY